MNDLRKAAEMALDALEDIFGKEKKDVGAIQALRQALAQPEQRPANFYLLPPQREWVGLTDEEIAKADCVAMDYVSGGEYGVAEETITEFARAIEQVLKEKNS
jgi:hypothetical protein